MICSRFRCIKKWCYRTLVSDPGHLYSENEAYYSTSSRSDLTAICTFIHTNNIQIPRLYSNVHSWLWYVHIPRLHTSLQVVGKQSRNTFSFTWIFERQKLSTTVHGHHKDGWPLCATLLGFAPTQRFLWCQSLCRLYKIILALGIGWD